MTVVLAISLAALLLLPYSLRQSAISPATGIGLWLTVLGLRALLAITGAFLMVLYLPATQLFQILTHWCFHTVVPFVSDHLGFSGHRLGDVATLVPALVLAISLVSAAVATWRATRTVRRWIGRSSVGRGPDESVIVSGEEIVLASAGLRAPRIVVSAGALCALDELELRAGLEHERGHIARRHRFVVLAGNLLVALSKPLPGSRSAWRHLQFHLERDADEYAIARTGDRLALASAICKAAVGAPAESAAFASLGGGSVERRLDLLLDGEPRSRAATALAAALLVGLGAIAVFLMFSAPAIASVGLEQLQGAGAEPVCPD
jgi:hypothetical protein